MQEVAMEHNPHYRTQMVAAREMWRKQVGTSRMKLPSHPGGTMVTTMIDEMTKDRLYLSTDGTAGPYLMVPMPQLASVRALLDRHAVRYWVDSEAISLDHKPAIAVINFGRAGDPASIQALLDETG